MTSWRILKAVGARMAARWTHRSGLSLMACAAMLAGLGGLVGCTATVPKDKDLTTTSDLTDVDRKARVRLELATAYFGRGNTTTALDEVKQAIVAKPDMVDAYSLRGLIYAALSEPELAEGSFRHALKLAPADFNAMHNYAWFLCQQRRFGEADAQFEQLLALPSFRDTPRALLAKGVCQARNNRWQEAERTLSRSYELDPANPATAVNLSEVLYREGEFERARFYIRRVNANDEQVSAQTLWLALRIENRLRQDVQVKALASQLHNRFPEAPETLLYEKGRLDE
jgi:type IV pilus assembly protein PilF